jgi:hypothetical protein
VPATTSDDQLEFSSESRSKKLYEEMSRSLRRTKNCNEMENFDKNTKEIIGILVTGLKKKILKLK